MSADIIDFQTRKHIKPPERPETLEQMATEILAPFYESSLGWVDTAPSEVPFGGAGIDGMDIGC